MDETSETDQKNYISCLTWVRRGVAASVPDKIELTPQELQNIIQNTQSELNQIKEEDDSEDEEAAGTNESKNTATDEEMKDGSVKANDEFDFDKYDDEADDIYANIDGIAVINEGKDPLVTVGDSEDEDSEKEDDIIKANDNLVLVGHIMDEASILEVYVYNEAEGSFYCHHHDYLSYIPLCFEWLNFDPSEEKPGNLCAIGNDTPIIEVWDLDVVGGIGPVFKLGKKPNKKKHIKRVGHTDAVLDIAWNTSHNHVLASGSADKTVLLWDLENGTPSTKLSSFEGIIQSIKWHQTEAHMLLTGSMDKKVRLFDCKTEVAKTWKASGEVEKVVWNRFDSNLFFVSTDNGYIECVDIRHDKPLWKKQVQEVEIAGLSMSVSCPGLLVSTNKDGTIKVWDVKNYLEPQLVLEKQTNLGHIICLESSCDSPFIFAAGGDNKANNLNVYDLSTMPEVSERFQNRELIHPAHVVDFSKTNKLNTVNEEVMEVADDIGSIALESKRPNHITKKKKKPRHRNFK
ncbi:periodic tryptophan protein 1 homolog [Nasonia vitripennis]|uniref:Periodic tryptophan protein 1 homolog n=1 Tax=Nasonia vitripennis TaxID=7425 RepID=A0A7M7G175_NASVI|nr:periodic tryptophan protein 1 homolog [Nasonia vitripennis]